MKIFIGLVCSFYFLYSQETREFIQHSTKIDDLKPNTNTVSTVYGIDTQFTSVVVVRLKYRQISLQDFSSGFVNIMSEML